MITDRRELDGGRDPDDRLRAATVLAVQQAPAAHEWSDVVQRSEVPYRDGSRLGQALLLAVAVVSVLGVAGALFVVTRSDNETVRTDDPPVPTQPTPPVRTDEAAGESLPALPSELTRAWSTTIEGSYPQSAVRIGETIIFGQQDLPGVRAIDARSGAQLWSFEVDAPDPDSTIVAVNVVDDRALISWMDSRAAQMVTALDSSGAELWTASAAIYVSGAVISGSANRLDLIGADGSVERSVDNPGQLALLVDDQFMVEDGEGFSWYRLPGLERIVGPVSFPTRPVMSVATADDIVTLEGTLLRFFDQNGMIRSELEIERAGMLVPVEGDRPGVLVVDASRQLGVDVRTTFYENVDDVITEGWSRTGRYEEIVVLDGRTFVVQTETIEGSADETEQHIIDVATGSVVVSNDSYDPDGTRNGFVFVQLDDGSSDVQTVAYDQDGREMWRLQLDGLERAEIVDNGVLVAIGRSLVPSVELTFYD